ncbi:MAG: hypothetical protein GXO82_11300 [Chlorobi bacterium]|nr:hypothetical protein [Chlorobiota bacterium]
MNNGWRLIWICVLFTACGRVTAQPQQRFENLRVSDQLVVNHFSSDPERYESHLVITDVEGAGPVVNVLLYSDDGTLVDQDFFFLSTFGKVNYNPAERLGKRVFSGSLRIISDGGKIAAQYWQFYRDPDLAPLNTALPASEGKGGRALLCQHFVSDPKVDASLYISNARGDSAVTVAITFYLDRGKQLSKDRYTIPPNGKIAVHPYEANEGIIKTGVAYVEVRGFGAITGEYWQKAPAENYQVSLPLEIIPVRKKDWW